MASSDLGLVRRMYSDKTHLVIPSCCGLRHLTALNGTEAEWGPVFGTMGKGGRPAACKLRFQEETESAFLSQS